MSFLHKDSVLLFDHTFTYCKAFFHDLTLGYTPKEITELDKNGNPIGPEIWIIVDSNGCQVGTQTFSSCAAAQEECDRLNGLSLKPQPPKTRAKGMSP